MSSVRSTPISYPTKKVLQKQFCPTVVCLMRGLSLPQACGCSSVGGNLTGGNCADKGLICVRFFDEVL